VTLVVGCATPDIGFLVADTLLSHAFELKGHTGPVNGKFHALKIQILNPTTAVAFAGDVGTSFALIGDLRTKLSTDPTIDPCKELLASYGELATTAAETVPSDCEFLVLQLTPAGKRLGRVTRDEVFYCTRAYIGDAAEYKFMRQLQRPHPAPMVQHVQQSDGTFSIVPLVQSEGEIEFDEISDAMEALTHRRQSDSVGAIAGCVTRVVDARISRELEYLQAVEASLTPWEGYSGFSLLTSNSGSRGAGVYYRSGKVGFLFVVGDREPCHKEYAETLKEFIELARAGYGLNLEGGAWGE
jgi:hypothetical protein